MRKSGPIETDERAPPLTEADVRALVVGTRADVRVILKRFDLKETRERNLEGGFRFDYVCLSEGFDVICKDDQLSTMICSLLPGRIVLRSAVYRGWIGCDLPPERMPLDRLVEALGPPDLESRFDDNPTFLSIVYFRDVYSIHYVASVRDRLLEEVRFLRSGPHPHFERMNRPSVQ